MVDGGGSTKLMASLSSFVLAPGRKAEFISEVISVMNLLRIFLLFILMSVYNIL